MIHLFKLHYSHNIHNIIKLIINLNNYSHYVKIIKYHHSLNLICLVLIESLNTLMANIVYIEHFIFSYLNLCLKYKTNKKIIFKYSNKSFSILISYKEMDKIVELKDKLENNNIKLIIITIKLIKMIVK